MRLGLCIYKPITLCMRVQHVSALQTNTSRPFDMSIKWHLYNFLQSLAKCKFRTATFEYTT